MSIRIGMPNVGRFCFETSGLLLSLPPGVLSQATAPHMLPLHCATLMLAIPSATFQSPVGSAAMAQEMLAAKAIPEKISRVRMEFRAQCNIAKNLCLL